MIEPRQIRAARALLNWSQDDLAKASGIARSSIKNVENELTIARKETLDQITRAFEGAGLEFLPNSGVRIKNDMVVVIEGEGATRTLVDNIFNACQMANEHEVLIIGLDESYSEKLDGKGAILEHVHRLEKAGIKEKIIICEGDRNYLNHWSSYHWIPKTYFEKDAPIYIFADKVAIHAGNVDRKTIIINHKPLAQHLKKLFHFMWDSSQMAPPRKE